MGEPARSTTPAPRGARISRDAIVAAARRLLDESGVAGLSMRTLADAVGSSPMALYRHVEDRRDLEIAVARSVSTELDLRDDPAVEPEASIAAWMRAVRAHWLRHPWFGHVLGSHPELADVMAGVGAVLVRALQRAGADDRLAGQEVVRITRTTLGIVVLEQAAPLSRRASREAPSELRATPSSTPGVALAVAAYDDDELFEHVIQATLAGLRARLAEGPLLQGGVHVHH